MKTTGAISSCTTALRRALLGLAVVGLCSALMGAAPVRARAGALANASADPVAGNPNSLASKMLDADFFVAESGPFVDVSEDTGNFVEVDHWLRTEADFSYFNAKGTRGESYDIGIGYGMNLPGNRWALVFDLPLALTNSGDGVLAFMGSGAVGAQFRARSWWNLTAVVRAGFMDSSDLDSRAVLCSGSVISTTKWKYKGFDMTMGNLFGIGSNIDRVAQDDQTADYDLLLGLFENGLTVGKPIRTRFFGKRLRWEAFYRLSSFVGRDLFLNNQHGVGLRYSAGGHADGMSLEVGWAGGKDYDALRLRLIARF